ncbi:hypothetical protein [Psychroserpens mesophilus]|uniref:hypothetical protein n=1 Tax=Psychroserpens mesophilus TaxID=325473 RepID=UPI00058E7CF1|nr:hypothetical protein [Psychroserpens mesophilus]
MHSIKDIRENYKGFDDSKIENIAKNESKRLRKEVLEILKSEIEKRNLDQRLITWVDAETNTLTDFERKTLTDKILNLNCPNCGNKYNKLSGQKLTTIISFIIYSSKNTKKRILCDSCAKKNRIESLLTTGILGWWSLKGLIVTPYTIINEIINISFHKEKISDGIINEFLEQNNGMIRLHGMDNKNLSDLILWHNNDYEIIEMDEQSEKENE